MNQATRSDSTTPMKKRPTDSDSTTLQDDEEEEPMIDKITDD